MTDNRGMRKAAATLAIVAVIVVSVAAQADLTGEWAMEFTTPRGHADYTLYLTQEGPRLTGHLTSEYGETAVKGSVNGDEVKLAWSIMENGKPMDISVTATAKGDTLNGTIKLGTVGEGVFTAERTGGQ